MRRAALFSAAVAVTAGVGGLVQLAAAAADRITMAAISAGALALAWAVLVAVADHFEHAGRTAGRDEVQS